MAHVVPSQVCELIRTLFPDVEREQAVPGQRGLYNASRVRAVLDQLDKIPDELIRLPAKEAALFQANVSALRSALADRNQSADQLSVSQISPSGFRPLTEILKTLANCPDEAPAPATRGLEFISDAALRDVLRADMSTASSALTNHEYKASTVLAGSVVEAMLLWALQTHGEVSVRAASSVPNEPLNKWSLDPMIKAGHACGLIGDDTRKQAELAQNFRNLIHPGRQARLSEKCDRGTALAALAAIERVSSDLAKKFP
jgi:hypothetical protein